MPALVGLAMAHNGNGEPEAALAYARKVVASSGNDQLYWLALGELTLALASSTGQLSSELESAFDAIRNLLDDIPAGSLPNRLRQRLCWARGLLPEGEPEGLARSEKVYSRQEVHADGVGLKPPQRIFSPTIAVSREDQRRLGESEEVVIHAVVDVDGCVLGGEIVADSNDVWTEIVWEALRRHVFEPARLDGEPVKAFVTLRFDYPTPFQEKGSSIPTAPPAGP